MRPQKELTLLSFPKTRIRFQEIVIKKYSQWLEKGKIKKEELTQAIRSLEQLKREA